jgi:hypothetical protein
MGKFIRATAFVLLLAYSASAGVMINGVAQPEPSPQPSPEAQQQTTTEDETETSTVVQVVLDAVLDVFAAL